MLIKTAFFLNIPSWKLVYNYSRFGTAFCFHLLGSPRSYIPTTSIPFYALCCSPFWVLSSLRRRLHSTLSSARLLHPRIPRICDMSLRMTSSNLVLGFPTGFLLRNFPLRNFLGSFHLPFSYYDPIVLVF